MNRARQWLVLALCLLAAGASAADPDPGEPLRKAGAPDVRILQVMDPDIRFRNYPYALSTLLRELNARSSVKVNPDPVVVANFEDPAIFLHPFIYVNFADRSDWSLSPRERQNLRQYLERGVFLFVDAGISAEFLRGDALRGQHHSFAEWEAHPDLEAALQSIWPEKRFTALTRSHGLFRSLYKGLPDASQLPDTVRQFVVNEKWPQGTYSAVGLEVNGRIAVLATPIIAMGWGKDQLGNWRTTIGFRIRESAPGLDDYLQTAAYSGERFEVRREDDAKDVVYCQQGALPVWVREPDDRWRVFRYYHGRQISDFAHVFYTQLGLNIITYALTH